MLQRTLGPHTVGAIGFGTMSLGGAYGPCDEQTAFATLDAAWEAGITHFDTANIYGMGVAEEVLGAWLKARSHAGVVLATKAAIIPGPPRAISNEGGHLRQELTASLRRLGRERVDLFYLHRREIARPLPEVIETLKDLIAEGLIGGYGLSEVSPATLRQAQAIHPVMAVQNEYSLWSRLPELGLLNACEELGVAFVAFSPLGRGIFARDEMLAPQDGFRTANPRFQEPAFRYNKAQVAGLRAFAQARGWTLPQLAVAWTLQQSPQIISLPGTRLAAHLDDWARADRLSLTPEDLSEIARILPRGFAQGDRYAAAQVIGVETYA